MNFGRTLSWIHFAKDTSTSLSQSTILSGNVVIDLHLEEEPRHAHQKMHHKSQVGNTAGIPSVHYTYSRMYKWVSDLSFPIPFGRHSSRLHLSNTSSSSLESSHRLSGNVVNALFAIPEDPPKMSLFRFFSFPIDSGSPDSWYESNRFNCGELQTKKSSLNPRGSLSIEVSGEKKRTYLFQI